ncbi:S-adenosylmethionine decarboxylase proenzyme [Clostridium sp. N37]|uniref:S-adenosylmethionine decarboxylase proenzyme n=1 Tax=Clostridium faecium TaxID=2762223 RepID=A0ABR8YRS3_9CLOT|nr:S-adenosylmethionine decarboxylase proenzyme [Clostridium faecium]
MKLNRLGRHILVEYYNCDKKVLNNYDRIEKYMIKAAEKAKAKVVTSTFHMFNPWGVSGAVIIQESHLTIHTWPEYGYAAVDLFTCGDDVNPWNAFKYLEKELKAGKVDYMEISRGIVDRIRKNAKEDIGEIKIKP